MSKFLAHFQVKYPAAIVAALVILALASLGVIVYTKGFDAEVLNVLPRDVTAVSSLSTYQKQFTKNSELAFVLEWSEAPEDIEAATAEFVALLEQESWVESIFKDAPLDDMGVVGPLLLNLEATDFTTMLDSLAPELLGKRLQKLVTDISRGSPRAQFELQFDPLGLMQAALAPIRKSVAVDRAFARFSDDGRLALVPCTANDADPATLMPQVREFIKRAQEKLGSEGSTGSVPPQVPSSLQILVTGTAPYVEETTASMERDIQLTSFLSMAVIILAFWVAFRRLLPLVGIAAILGTAALVAIALGILMFGSLNVIAIGFCSMLFGLGNDFSLLICQRYITSSARGLGREGAIARALAKTAPSIACVALTTSLGFLALYFAGSPGFRQLGVLVSLGIVLAALLTISALPVFLRGGTKKVSHRGTEEQSDTEILRESNTAECTQDKSLTFTPSQSLCASVPPCLCAKQKEPETAVFVLYRRPARMLAFGITFAIVCAVVALSPWRPLAFDLSPKSLEPRHIPAAQAVQMLMERLPGSFEPTLVLVENPTSEKLVQLDEVFASLVEDGLVTTVSSPTPLFLDPARIVVNAEALEQFDASGLQAILDDAGVEYSPAETFENLKKLARTGRWEDCLAAESPWWFLLRRTIGADSKLLVATLRVPDHVTAEQRRELATRIAAVEGASATGWQQTLSELVPWAYGELFFFAVVVFSVIVIVLGFVYRDFKLWFLHLVALATAAAFTIAFFKFTGAQITVLNVLTLPLIIGVGVDYGMHILLAVKEHSMSALHNIFKPVFLCGITTVMSFAALMFAQNPALVGLGTTCAIGVAACLASAFLIVAPASVILARKSS